MDLQMKLKEGEALFLDGQLEKAEALFLEVLDTHPEHTEALNNLGVIHHSRGNIEEAKKLFLKAVEVDSQYIRAISNLADIYENAREWEKAALQVQRLLELTGGKNGLQSRLARLQARLTPDKQEKPSSLAQKGVHGQLADSHSAITAVPQQTSFRAAFLEVNITPAVSATKPIYLQGMAGTPRKATSILNPLMLQILLMEDANFTKILFVAADLFGFGKEIVDLVQETAAPWGIPPEGILLNASHTHYAPGTVSQGASVLGPFNPQYAKAIANTIGQSLDFLFEKLEDCEIGLGQTKVRIGVNRRTPSTNGVSFAPNEGGAYDEHTPFLRIQLKKTGKSIVVVNHGCHPTGLGGLSVLSSDFVGYLREALKRQQAADAVMFLQGAAGSSKQCVYTEKGKACFTQSEEHIRQNGIHMAQQIASALQSQLIPVSGTFFCTSSTAAIPLKAPPTKDHLEALLKSPEAPSVMREWAQKALDAHSKGPYPNKMTLEVQLLSIGNTVQFVTLPGEPVSELGLALRESGSNPAATFILGYTNGLIGYLPTDAMIAEGGYEPHDSSFFYLLPSPFAQGAEKAITDSLDSCYTKATKEREPNGYGRYHLTKNPKRAFFVLSSGRCGTLTLAKVLSTASNARVWHHPKPFLINEGLAAYRSEIDLKRVFLTARSQILLSAWAGGKIHGETDVTMTPFCQAIASALPEARFLILIRDPRDFVRSGMRRNYYEGHPWDSGRLRPEEGNQSLAKFNSLDQFEKVCWLWAETYRRIAKLADVIGRERVMTVKFEEFIASVDIIKEIFRFLGLEGFDSARIKRDLHTKHNAQTTGHFPKPKDWPTEFHGKLSRQCREVAEYYGYDLEDATAGSSKRPIEKPAFVSKRDPRVTIRFNVYNGGDSAIRAVESILNQDFEDFELIIGDNASTDQTPEICQDFATRDRRVTYYRNPVNLGIARNMEYGLGQARGEFFMWMQHDNWHEPAFLSKCLEYFEADVAKETVLVFPKARLYQRGKCLGVYDDKFQADADSPAERFSQVIWNLGICNCLLGLYRHDALVKTNALRSGAYRAHDSVLMVELALMGKLVQIENVLFNRVMSRDYSKPNNNRNLELIKDISPEKMNDGITFPFCRLAYSQLLVVNRTHLPPFEKDVLMMELVDCYKKRYGRFMQDEIKRADSLISEGRIDYFWAKNSSVSTSGQNGPTLTAFILCSVIRRLQEASLVLPDYPLLGELMNKCSKMIAEMNK